MFAIQFHDGLQRYKDAPRRRGLPFSSQVQMEQIAQDGALSVDHLCVAPFYTHLDKLEYSGFEGAKTWRYTATTQDGLCLALTDKQVLDVYRRDIRPDAFPEILSRNNCAEDRCPIVHPTYYAEEVLPHRVGPDVLPRMFTVDDVPEPIEVMGNARFGLSVSDMERDRMRYEKKREQHRHTPYTIKKPAKTMA